METLGLTTDALAALIQDLLDENVEVIAPALQGSKRVYRRLQVPTELDLGGRPDGSLKAHFLPPSEPLLRWHQNGNKVELEEIPTTCAPRVILGALPCDAAAVDIVNKVMNWDYKDELWNGRREATTVLSLACDHGDKDCFCTSVGLAPDSPRGADLLLVPSGEAFGVEVHTERGAAFVQAHQAHFGPAPDPAASAAFREQARARIAPNLKIDPAAITAWLAANFQHPFWDDVALNCHGCGACAYVCPTCHCFDIVDEPEGPTGGTRRRNWDTCQDAVFTLHGAGHNPRPHQNSRARQRLQHKFRIYPERFEDILCTGCGRCMRVCAGGADLIENLQRLQALATEQQAPEGER